MRKSGRDGVCGMKGTDIIDALLRKLRVSTDTELAATLGITGQAIRNWRERKTIAPRQVAGLVHRGQLASRKEIYNSAIRPVVEFFRINKTIRRGIRRAACSSCARGRAARQNPAFAKGVQIRIGREKNGWRRRVLEPTPRSSCGFSGAAAASPDADYWRCTPRACARRRMNSCSRGRKNALLKYPSGGSGSR